MSNRIGEFAYAKFSSRRRNKLRQKEAKSPKSPDGAFGDSIDAAGSIYE